MVKLQRRTQELLKIQANGVEWERFGGECCSGASNEMGETGANYTE